MDGPPPPEEDFSTLPISERLAHKNWKARVSAYESLIKTFSTTASDNDPAFKPYVSNSDLLRKIVTDANAVAQEKGVDCIVNFVRYAGETAARTRDAVVPALVDKCLGSTRAGTKNHAIELCLQYVEVENGGAGVVTDILPGLGAKQPKAVAGCIVALKEIVRLFGTQTTPPPTILKALPKVFGHSDKTVRAEGTALTRVLYQYMGQAIEPWLADLKPVQVKELKDAFDAMEKDGKGKGSIKPERMTRSQAREAEHAAESGGNDGPGDGGDSQPNEDLDPRAFAEPVDITSKIPPSSQLSSSKWKERKEAMDDFSAVLKATPKIKEATEYLELAKTLASSIPKDSNINCVISAANCIEGLALGLGIFFGRARETTVPPMLEKLKERKVSVTDALGAALDAVFTCTTLADMVPDLLSALGHKNPQVKEGTLKLLTRCISTSKAPLPPAQVKPTAEALAGLLEDGNEGARNEAATALGTLMKMVGERPLGSIMEGIADLRKAKVKESFEKATVKAKAGGAAPPPRAAPPPTKAPAKTPAKKPAAPAASRAPEATSEEPPAPVKKVAKLPARLMKPGSSAPPAAAAPPPVKKATAPPAAATKPNKGGAPSAGSLDTFKYRHTPEDADALAAELIPASIMASLADANWKTRLSAMDELTEWIEGSVTDLDSEVIIRALAKKGWSEKNFQVSSKLYSVLSLLAEKCPSFGRSSVALSVPHLVEKLGDLKLKKPASETLMTFAERTSLQFVLNQAYEPISKQKAPKVIADAVSWVNSALIDFGTAGISLRALIDCLKSALQNSNAAVRTSATKTLVTVKLFAGSGIKDFIQDLNPQLLNTITSEFDKVEGNPAPEPTRTSADLAATTAATGSGGSGGGSGAVADPIDDLFPRVEIDGLLKGTTILADAKSDAWKSKKEALESLQAILDQGANKRLKPTMGDIGQVLKARVVDSNKAVQNLALDIVARIAAGMGKPFDKQTRFFTVPVCSVLSDQKAPIRAAALRTLNAMATACESLDSMTNNLGTALEATNPQQKSTLLQWLNEWFQQHPPSSSLDISSWTAPVVTSLDDRNTDVRKAAQAILPTLVACVGFDHVMHQANSLKPASKATAIPLIQEARGAGEPSIPAAKAPAMSPPPTPKSATLPSAPAPQAPDPAPAATTSRLAPVRRKLPTGSGMSSKIAPRSETPVDGQQTRLPSKLGGLKQQGASSNSVPAPISPTMAFHGTNMDAKKSRQAKDANKWINEGGATRKDLADLLQSQMENHASKELIKLLFSHDNSAINDHIAGMALMVDLFNNAQDGDQILSPVCLANLDLPLKYASIKIHEPQSNLVAKCLDLVEAVLAFVRSAGYQLNDSEAQCFIPTMVHKLGDPREQTRLRVQLLIQELPKSYSYSRLFQILLDNGLKSKVAKTRQGAVDELANLLKRSGLGACDPPKAFPAIAALISDKDPNVRKSSLNFMSEGYTLGREKVWQWVGPLSSKDRTQLEERIRRVAGPSHAADSESPVSSLPRSGLPRSGGIPRPASPSVGGRFGRPASPALSSLPRPASPSIPGSSRLATVSPPPRPESPATHTSRIGSGIPAPGSALLKPKSKLAMPSKLARPPFAAPSRNTENDYEDRNDSHKRTPSATSSTAATPEIDGEDDEDTDLRRAQSPDDSDSVTVIISSILSSDASRSVDALKKVQKILSLGPDSGPSSPQYRDLADHTEGLIETITLQMAHIFDRPDELVAEANFRLAKHLIQTLNNFCDHKLLAESLTVDVLTSLLEELTLRLLETDDSSNTTVKDLSRFINMIILRLFATGRKMSIFRSLFILLLRIVKPFPVNRTPPESKEPRVAELVLKCLWKLAKGLPQDLSDQKVDPVELFPAVEHFLQSIPPNEWRARSTNGIPCGDMPLRTIKVIIQHVVMHYGDEVYDLLSLAFEDPSATIVYPYVYRCLNSSTNAASRANDEGAVHHNGQGPIRQRSPSPSRPLSRATASSSNSFNNRSASPSRRTSPQSVGRPDEAHGVNSQEPDPDAQLRVIINHISNEYGGAMHKEGITELYQFLKAHPSKRTKVDKILESTGPAFSKYINRALQTRKDEDKDRDAAVADTLSRLEANTPTTPTTPSSPAPRPLSQLYSPRQLSPPPPENAAQEQKLSRLHKMFQYNRASVINSNSGHDRPHPGSP